MKKAIYSLILPLVVAGGLVFSNHETKNETPPKSTPKSSCNAAMKTEREKWEATPEGIKYKTWEVSSVGQNVLDGSARISMHIRDSSNMEAVVTSLSLPPGSRLGFGVMARIDGVDYILNFEPEESQLEQLQSLKVNDKIIIRSRMVSHAPKYAYPIVRGEYVERNGKIIYKHIRRKGGC